MIEDHIELRSLEGLAAALKLMKVGNAMADVRLDYLMKPSPAPYGQTPTHSTNVQAALAFSAEALPGFGIGMSISQTGGNYAYISSQGEQPWIASSDAMPTLPLAICLATVKAKIQLIKRGS